ncbi:glycosyltransferase [Acidianus sp. HS-5]|uniref:glycosyltransferase n=1 Tax=Acidianus sp. HS-5 TaxID=2886040 RepID=UPI001F1C1C1A|nr:glycosyltransferase [Acidianus sp. HS-5]BDC17226.1 dolichyl-phosphate mannose synthase [Acidianus sp. HS-5]
MLSIVIPAFNEEKRIGSTLNKLSIWYNSSEIIVVFDGNDNTPEVVKEYNAKLYVSKERLGKGGSLKKGIEFSSYKKILLIDADLPVTRDDLNKIISTNADLVVTTRKMVGMPWKRRFLHKGFILLTKFFFPSLRKFKDFQSGVKLVDREKALRSLDNLIINDFLFDVNLIYEFKRRGYKIKEEEISYIHDETDSKISRKLIKIIVLMFLSLVKLRVYYSPFKGILKSRTYLKAQDFILRILR